MTQRDTFIDELFKIAKEDKKEIEKIILVKVPGDIYSELRKIFLSGITLLNDHK